MSKILAIARMTVKGELRNRLIYILLAVALLFLFMARGCAPAKINIEKGFINPEQITRAGMLFTFNCILFWGLSLCGLLAMNAIPRELDEETIVLTITKPVKRSWFLAGKFLGIFFIVFSNLMVLTLCCRPGRGYTKLYPGYLSCFPFVPPAPQSLGRAPDPWRICHQFVVERAFLL
jgi:ABC-type transport system involved in multi-copper enzyme maturation permease subunit